MTNKLVQDHDPLTNRSAPKDQQEREKLSMAEPSRSRKGGKDRLPI